MFKREVIKKILGKRILHTPQQTMVKVFAPSNIALCKYWGKRNSELNLPMTSSLSISLGEKGVWLTLKISENGGKQEILPILNGTRVLPASAFYRRLQVFIDLFSLPALSYEFNIESNIPIAAGLASSACGFASIVTALNRLFDWQLAESELSILARLGSGSAARSLWQGFVEWECGNRDDGLDSFAKPLISRWPDLCIGLWVLASDEKLISSRVAMERTLQTSLLYRAWPTQVAQDLSLLKTAISEQHFKMLGETAENNAMAMHACMLAAQPAISYALPDTISAIQKVQQLRSMGLPVYFTQDAGPNLKLLFLAEHKESVLAEIPMLAVVQPFSSGINL